jgi:hypothetical protein
MGFKKAESNNAICARLKGVRAHPNANNVKLATVCGEQVVVSLDAKDDDLVVYFDGNLRISKEFLYNNNQYEKPEMNKDSTKKGYFGRNGKVKVKKFRGEPSYGFAVTLDYFDYLGIRCIKFEEGVEFTHIDSNLICEKFVNLQEIKKINNSEKNRINSSKKITSQYFKQHWDTAHYKRLVNFIPTNRMLYIEEKIHGTSGRIAKVLMDRKLSSFEKILKFFGVKVSTQEYEYFNGTRRVNLTTVLNPNSYYKGDMRTEIFNKLSPMLKNGEQLYFEIFGFDTDGGAIQKGFSYGCVPCQYKVMLYRITQINDSGTVFEMPREYVYGRALELGILPPPVFAKYHYTGNVDELNSIVNSYTDGLSTYDINTMKEGVVVWFEDCKGVWTCLKNKSYDFIERESKAKDAGEVDIEDQTEG